MTVIPVLPKIKPSIFFNALDHYELIVGFSLVGKFFISMQLVTVNVITAELFPTASRGLTIGLCSTMGKMGGIFAPIMSAMVNLSISFTAKL